MDDSKNWGRDNITNPPGRSSGVNDGTFGSRPVFIPYAQILAEAKRIEKSSLAPQPVQFDFGMGGRKELADAEKRLSETSFFELFSIAKKMDLGAGAQQGGFSFPDVAKPGQKSPPISGSNSQGRQGGYAGGASQMPSALSQKKPSPTRTSSAPPPQNLPSLQKGGFLSGIFSFGKKSAQKEATAQGSSQTFQSGKKESPVSMQTPSFQSGIYISDRQKTSGAGSMAQGTGNASSMPPGASTLPGTLAPLPKIPSFDEAVRSFPSSYKSSPEEEKEISQNAKTAIQSGMEQEEGAKIGAEKEAGEKYAAKAGIQSGTEQEEDAKAQMEKEEYAKAQIKYETGKEIPYSKDGEKPAPAPQIISGIEGISAKFSAKINQEKSRLNILPQYKDLKAAEESDSVPGEKEISSQEKEISSKIKPLAKEIVSQYSSAQIRPQSPQAFPSQNISVLSQQAKTKSISGKIGLFAGAFSSPLIVPKPKYGTEQIPKPPPSDEGDDDGKGDGEFGSGSGDFGGGKGKGGDDFGEGSGGKGISIPLISKKKKSNNLEAIEELDLASASLSPKAKKMTKKEKAAFEKELKMQVKAQKDAELRNARLSKAKKTKVAKGISPQGLEVDYSAGIIAPVMPVSTKYSSPQIIQKMRSEKESGGPPKPQIRAEGESEGARAPAQKIGSEGAAEPEKKIQSGAEGEEAPIPPLVPPPSWKQMQEYAKEAKKISEAESKTIPAPTVPQSKISEGQSLLQAPAPGMQKIPLSGAAGSGGAKVLDSAGKKPSLPFKLFQFGKPKAAQEGDYPPPGQEKRTSEEVYSSAGIGEEKAQKSQSPFSGLKKLASMFSKKKKEGAQIPKSAPAEQKQISQMQKPGQDLQAGKILGHEIQGEKISQEIPSPSSVPPQTAKPVPPLTIKSPPPPLSLSEQISQATKSGDKEPASELKQAGGGQIQTPAQAGKTEEEALEEIKSEKIPAGEKDKKIFSELESAAGELASQSQKPVYRPSSAPQEKMPSVQKKAAQFIPADSGEKNISVPASGAKYLPAGGEKNIPSQGGKLSTLAARLGVSSSQKAVVAGGGINLPSGQDSSYISSSKKMRPQDGAGAKGPDEGEGAEGKGGEGETGAGSSQGGNVSGSGEKGGGQIQGGTVSSSLSSQAGDMLAQKPAPVQTSRISDEIAFAYAKEKHKWLYEIYKMGGMTVEEFRTKVKQKMEEDAGIAAQEQKEGEGQVKNPAFSNLNKAIDKKFKK